jgi:hypothetical protein
MSNVICQSGKIGVFRMNMDHVNKINVVVVLTRNRHL